jgi:ABC-type polar amino acid transport system, ATPase component
MSASDIYAGPPEPSAETIRLAVELIGVSKSFGQREVLQALDLEVTEGEVVVVIGGSGSGKSTMLRCIAGLELINAGEIRIEGVPVQRAWPDGATESF